MNEAVADAGPIIHLYELNCLSLLEVFDVLHVADAVWMKCTARSRIPPAILEATGALQRDSVDENELARFVSTNNLLTLQRGELESLYLCRHFDIDTMLTDDLAARDAAKQLNIRPVGSLGILIRAWRNNMITLEDAEHLLWKLYQNSSLFVTRAIVEGAIHQLKESEEGK